MPFIQLLHYRSHPTLLTSGREHDPGSGYFFVGHTTAADAGDRGIVDEVIRMLEETVLDFDWRYLGAGDFEGILYF